MRKQFNQAKVAILLSISIGFMIGIVIPGTYAQEATATASVNLNVRAEPSTRGVRLGQVPQDTELVAEGRNAASDWILIHARDGSVRGWVAAAYLQLNFEIGALPVVNETIGGTTTTDQNSTQNTNESDAQAVNIDSGIPTATTFSRLNMRSGPGTSNAIVTRLSPRTAIIVEGRNADASWIVGHTQDGAYRGWVAVAYVSRNFDVNSLPVVNASGSSSNSDTQGDGQNTPRSNPAGVVLAFLNARVDSNASIIRGLSCAAWRSRAAALADSFRSMEASLNGVACYQDGSDSDYSYVSCTGNIVTVYNGETRQWSISRYRLVEENGDWKVCGEAS